MKKKKEESSSDQAPMTMVRAQNLMVEFSISIYWQALLYILNTQDAQAVAMLATIDVFKDPTNASRSQGQRIAINFIRELVGKAAEIKQKRDENEKIADDEEFVPGYNGY